jgi:amino acid adenylation domain-containing protein
VQELFEERAELTPDAAALICGDQSLSYAELDTQATALAQYLCKMGVGPEVAVALCLERGAEAVVGQLAVLKAGGACVMLDPSAPFAQLQAILGQSAALVVVGQGLSETRRSELAQLVGDDALVDLDRDAARWSAEPAHGGLPAASSLDQGAYIVGESDARAVLSHGALSTMVQFAIAALQIMPSDRVLWLTAPWYAPALLELYVGLLTGAPVILAPLQVGDALALSQLLEREQITVMQAPPLTWEMMIEAGWPGWGALTAICSGAPLSATVADELHDRVASLWQAYGNVHTPLLSLTPIANGPSMDIRPIDTVRMYVLDGYGGLLPIGVAGELYIGGVQVGRGHPNRPQLTAERFVPDPFGVAGSRLYRTGDRARYLVDGRLELVSGGVHRELLAYFEDAYADAQAPAPRAWGTIETRARAYPGILDVAVVREEEGDRQGLLLYYSAQGNVDETALNDVLTTTVAWYLVPAGYVRLQALPRTNKGRLKTRALPALQLSAACYEAPIGQIETMLAQIWSDLLNVERVGRHDDFFKLGGHSLIAITLLERMRRAELHADIRMLFASPTLMTLAGALNGRGESDTVDVPPNLIPVDGEAITPEMLTLITLTAEQIERVVETVPGGSANVKDIYPLAPLQEGILFHYLLNERDPYVLAGVYRFDTRRRLDGFLAALQAVVARHDILRTSVVWEGLPEPVQVVWRHARLVVEEIAIDLGNENISEQLMAWQNSLNYHLDVRQAPLIRIFIARDTTTESWTMLVLWHHLCGDHTTLDVVQEEIRLHQLGLVEQLPTPLPFRNFVAQTRLGISREDHEVFFRAMLGDVTEPTLPYGLADVQGDVSLVVEARRSVDASLAARLRTCARTLGVSPASLHHLCFARVLGQLSDRDDVVFGTVLFGRMQGGTGAERVPGLFMNTLPVRLCVSDGGVQQSVMHTHALLAHLLRHEHAPLSLAQRCSAVAPPAPLFSALLNYRYSAIPTRTADEEHLLAWGGIETLGAVERTNYPFNLTIDDLGEEFGLTAKVQTPLDPERICNYMHMALEELADALEHASTRPVCTLDVLSKVERHRLVVDWNSTEAAYPATLCIQELFEAQVARTPDAVALADDRAEVTYAELNAQANQLAHYLRGIGVRPDTRVALCVERSLEMVVGMLAVLKAGGAYVPLDPNYPTDRLTFMLSDSAPVVLLTHGLTSTELQATLAEQAGQVLDLQTDAYRWADGPTDNPAELGLTPEHLAYVIYTSGSTGQPKGVMVGHRGVINLLWSMRTMVQVEPTDRLLALTTFGFDIAALELFLPLVCGACVVLASRTMSSDAGLLREALVRQAATIMQATPVTWRMLLESGWTGARDLKALCGGEALPVDLACSVHERVGSLWNVYGPTETTIWSSSERIEGGTSCVYEPIGRPIANTQMYVLDSHGKPAPTGVIGELYICGVGVARGYLHHPEQTAQRFVPDPFARDPGARMYRTGDLVRYLADGRIEFLGRSDFQVKVRGFRIELGEIEARLLQYPGIHEAVVLAREDSSATKYLVAYYVADPAAGIELEHLRGHLLSVLPDYMVPAAYVALDALPLTPNGKVDRRALPGLEDGAYARREYEAPIGEIEITMARIWTEVLKVEQVGRNDDFFALGGHSLLAIGFLERMRQSGLETDVRALFSASTLAGLAATIKGRRKKVRL